MTAVRNQVASARAEKARVTGLRGHRVQDPERMESRRQEILLAMASLLAEKGYDATTLDDVGARMSCSKAVIYYQFRSKEELYVELIKVVLGRSAEALRAIAGSDDPPDVQLRKAVTTLLRMGFEPMHYAAIRNGRPRSLRIENRALLRELDRVYEAQFMDIIARGMDAGVIVRRDVRLVAYTLINAIHSIFRWYRMDGVLRPGELEGEVPAMLLDGVVVRQA
ncbi:MAG: TetR/AcrR family transcriptional regulator [Dehalococcoidia bacterium]